MPPALERKTADKKGRYERGKDCSRSASTRPAGRWNRPPGRGERTARAPSRSRPPCSAAAARGDSLPAQICYAGQVGSIRTDRKG